MGVRGLTTFIANRSRQYLEDYELHDCYVVLDGHSIACKLYQWHCKCNDCFGGDYDKFARSVTDFFQLLFNCNITPLVVFDGGYEKRKLGTVISRMKNKINNTRTLNAVSEGSTQVFPLFLRDVFVDIIRRLNVKCVRCEFEGDGEAAYLAKSLQCPVISYDSDFYIFDCLYIPFSTVELNLKKRKDKTGKSINFIQCQLYCVQKFLDSFGGMNKINLPILSVLLGNDYIKKSVFSTFYRHMKLVKIKRQNEQQQRIKSVILWLQNETPESAIKKILSRYKQHRRKDIDKKINEAIKGYYCYDSDILQHFNLQPLAQENKIVFPKLEDIEFAPDNETAEDSADEAEESSSSDTELVQALESEETHLNNNVSNFFKDNFKKCLYPSFLMDMLTCHTYYCMPQIEDFFQEHSHTISLDILSAMHKILTLPETTKLICVSRNENAGIKKSYLEINDKVLPQLKEIELMNVKECRAVFFNILNLQPACLSLFPNSWHLLIVALEYWITSSRSKVDLSCVHSVILCAIILNYVDDKVGYYRTSRKFSAKYSSFNTKPKDDFIPANTIAASLEKLDKRAGVACLKKCIHYFEMDEKMKCNYRLFDRTIVHQFSQFQSCLLHIKYLNNLLKSPFADLIISDFYDGTFLYNMTANLTKRSDLKVYLRNLFEESPELYHACDKIVVVVQNDLNVGIVEHVPPKRRRKKKKPKNTDTKEEEVVKCESDGEYAFDANNRFSALSLINR